MRGKRKHETGNNKPQLPVLTSKDQNFGLRLTSTRQDLKRRALYNGFGSFDANVAPRFEVFHDGLQQGSSDGRVTTHDANIEYVGSSCIDAEGVPPSYYLESEKRWSDDRVTSDDQNLGLRLTSRRQDLRRRFLYNGLGSFDGNVAMGAGIVHNALQERRILESDSIENQDPPTDTSAILQAIMALTSKVDAISSDVESVKSFMTTLQTNTTIQHNILAQELATLKSQIQNHVSCSPPSHSSAQGLTSEMSALESEMKAMNHTLHTLQDDTTTSDANLTKGIDEISTQHFCFSVQLENFQNLRLKVHAAALNTETAVHNLNNLCVSVQTSLANSSKALEVLEAKVEASQPAFSEVQSGVVISKYLLDNLNDQVKILARATTSQKPSQQSAIPYLNEDDSETIRFERKRKVENSAQEEPGFKEQVTVETQRKTKGMNIVPVAQLERDAVRALFELKENREAIAIEEI